MSHSDREPDHPAEPAADAGPIDCDHCGLPVPAGLYEPESDRQFCCQGCKFAYQLIHEHQLEAFYSMVRRETDGAALRPSAKPSAEFSEYDQDAFLQRFGRQLDDQEAEINLVLDGIHCAACIWLIEKLPRILPGVLEVKLNWAKRTATIRWDQERVLLSQIAACLSQLGYRPHPVRESQKEKLRQAENRQHLIRIGIAAAAAGNNMLIATSLYLGMFSTMGAGMTTFLRVFSCVIGLAALIGPGRVFLQGAWSAVRTWTPHMDLPIALGLLVGTIAGLVNTIRGAGEIYFDSLSVLIFLLLVGRWIQFRQQNRAVDAVDMLSRLTPRTAHKLVDGRIVETFLDMIEVGDQLEVRAGELFPVDGVLIDGHTSVDESMLSGESRLVLKQNGDNVLAGTQNRRLTVAMEARTTDKDSRLSNLVTLVEQASAEKPELVQWANRIGGYFVAAVLMAAAFTFIFWIRFDSWIAVDRTVALLIVACPCALALATPLAISVALGRAAKRKIMIKGGDVLQRLNQPGMIWLDKTGTLTAGEMEVVASHGDRDWIPLVAALEANSIHPVGRAIISWAQQQSLDGQDLPDIAEFEIEHSAEGGLVARGPNCEVLIGTRKLLLQHELKIDRQWDAAANEVIERSLSPCWIAVDGDVKMLLGIGDRLRTDSQEAIDRLRSQGWQVGVLSGDHRSIVDQVGQRLGVPAELTVGGVVPEEKLEVVRESLIKYPTVVMVGDGVNDSAALAAASVGIAVHGGAEASLVAAPVYLVDDGLSPILNLLAISRSSRRTMRVNLTISLTYNLVFATLAFLGYINPLVAAILMPISSLTVVALSMTSGAITDPVEPHRNDQIQSGATS